MRLSVHKTSLLVHVICVALGNNGEQWTGAGTGAAESFSEESPVDLVIKQEPSETCDDVLQIHAPSSPLKTETAEEFSVRPAGGAEEAIDLTTAEEAVRKKPHACPMCEKSYSWRSHLEIHLRVHTGRNLSAVQSAATLHQKDVPGHSPAPPHGGETFQLLRLRRQVHFKGQRDEAHDGGSPESLRREEPSQTQLLRVRQSLHVALTPGDARARPHRREALPVSRVGKRFTQKATLLGHMTRHTGERPFSCPVCQKSFRQKNHVQKHINIHLRKFSQEQLQGVGGQLQGAGEQLQERANSCREREDSCRALEDTCRILEDSCRVLEDGCMVLEDGCRALNSCRALEDSCRALEDSCREREDTCRALEDSCRALEDSCREREDSCRALEDSCREREDSCRVLEDSCREREDSCRALEDSCRALNSCRTRGSPRFCFHGRKRLLQRRLWRRRHFGADSGSGQTNGRYSVKHEMKGSPPVDMIDVGISNMNLNDSGRYSCFWEESSGKRDNREFMAEVTDVWKQEELLQKHLLWENMLVETTGDSGRSGRYSLKYRKHADDLIYVDVTIKSVKKSDSGLYQCHLDERSETFRLEV
ncbi:hypothetical protein WMY93_032354 [Mugilogobius chulae]|uniref:C2H2-type domain-containing protein n=1 Tax=Mugilogobius chulae TaxID=88201 RepID=A0AAW0MLQ1_9GOBI